MKIKTHNKAKEVKVELFGDMNDITKSLIKPCKSYVDRKEKRMTDAHDVNLEAFTILRRVVGNSDKCIYQCRHKKLQM